MAKNSGKQAVGIMRIDGYGGNLLGIVEAQVCPGFSGIGGLVDSISDGEIGTMQAFAAGGVNDIGIGRASCRERVSVVV